MKALKCLLIFAVGACAGAAGAYYYAKDKFEKQNNEEQEALLAHYGINRTEEVSEAKAKSEQNLNKPSITEYKRVVEQTNYNAVSTKPVTEETDIPKQSKVLKPRKIEVIELEDAGTGSDPYEVVTLELYEDGVIATEDDHEVVNADDYFGNLDLEKIFEESEYGDCVYVRNHELKLDIELAKESGTYADLLASIYE